MRGHQMSRATRDVYLAVRGILDGARLRNELLLRTEGYVVRVFLPDGSLRAIALTNGRCARFTKVIEAKAIVRQAGGRSGR
jgi:hypothetical protein